jgi:thermostable 8-oxoguanine DNA glycosylase
LNINWDISQADIDKVKKVIADNENAFLQARQLRNVEKQNIVIDKNTIVKTMIMCLLTSQQRSGPNSTVGHFLRLSQFPITIEKLTKTNNVEVFVKDTLIKKDLTRYVNRISSFFASNYRKIVEKNWTLIKELEELKTADSKIKERNIADNLANDFKGFGPKQARNFLQALGLTKYEIPIDSRITTWLNDFGFPVTLTSSPLGDKGYYHFVSDGFQELCEKAEIYPCILDAAIFSSFDNNEWTDENTIF